MKGQKFTRILLEHLHLGANVAHKTVLSRGATHQVHYPSGTCEFIIQWPCEMTMSSMHEIV